MTGTTVYQERLRRVRLSTAQRVMGAWDMLPDYDKPRAEPFARAVIPVVTAGQMMTSKLTAAHLRRKGLAPPAIDPLAVTGEAVRKAPMLTVYQRPFGIVWGALAAGVMWADAVQRGRNRLDVLAQTDMALAMKATVDVVATGYGDRLTGWQRVADGGACDLCSAENGAVYDLAGDMPLHPGCGCSLEPVYGADDGTDSSYTATHDSDELGPLLYEAGHDFST